MRVKRPLAVTSLARAYDLQCPRYLTWILDPEQHPPQKMEDTAAGRELSRHGIEHEDRAISLLSDGVQVVVPEYPAGDLAAGTRITLELMEQHVPFIGQAPLHAELPGLPFPVHGLVDLLKLSHHGTNRSYQVMEIKSSRRIKTSQMLQATLYRRMVEQISDRKDLPLPVVVDGFMHEYPVPVTDFDPLVTEFLEMVIPRWFETDAGVFHRTPRCFLCPFDIECKTDARVRGHSSIISGVSRGVAQRMSALGADSPLQVDTGEPERLRSIAMDAGFIESIKVQANALVENRIIPVPTPSPIPSSVVELFLDIEPDPTGPYPCRLGLFKRDNSIQRTAYRGRIMPVESDEGPAHINAFIDLLIRQIRRAISQSKSWLLLYYGGSVAESLIKLAETSGAGDLLIDELFSNAIDIRTLLRRIWHVPVERYALSEVLSACGLRYESDDPGFVLYRQWRSSQENERSEAEKSLLEHGERYCESLMSLWNRMQSTSERINER